MRRTLVNVVGTIFLGAVLTMLSCTTLRNAPDPASIREQIAEARMQEIALIRETVRDPARADKFIELLGQRDRMFDEQARQILEYRTRLAALNANYDASREDFEVLIADFNRRRATAQQDSIALVVAMKDLATAEEWRTISDFQIKRLHPRKLSYGQASEVN